MKQFSFWVFLFSICLALPLKAQNDLSFENDSIQEEIIGLIPESLDSDIDSLLRSWHVQYFTKKKKRIGALHAWHGRFLFSHYRKGFG